MNTKTGVVSNQANVLQRQLFALRSGPRLVANDEFSPFNLLASEDAGMNMHIHPWFG